jgi:biopolymer transport protein ExbD
MDIFTILVFFLLVNSSQVETLERHRAIDMPESVAQQKPRETVVVMVTADAVLVQGKPVATTAEIVAQEGDTVVALRDALQAQVARLIVRDGADDVAAREVTIMGDKDIPYRVLKKVMSTCTEANYGQISLAVMQKGAAVEDGSAS